MTTDYDEYNEGIVNGKTIKSIEHPGYNSTYHRKPEDVGTREWFQITRSFHTRKGHVVIEALAAVEFKRDPYDPYPLKSEVEGWGVEIVWR